MYVVKCLYSDGLSVNFANKKEWIFLSTRQSPCARYIYLHTCEASMDINKKRMSRAVIKTAVFMVMVLALLGYNTLHSSMSSAADRMLLDKEEVKACRPIGSTEEQVCILCIVCM